MKILYFAWVREKTGISAENIEIPQGVETIAELINWLKTRGPEFEAAFKNTESIRAAIDQVHVNHNTAIDDAMEVAFFPPVTGG